MDPEERKKLAEASKKKLQSQFYTRKDVVKWELLEGLGVSKDWIRCLTMNLDTGTIGFKFESRDQMNKFFSEHLASKQCKMN